MSDTEPRSFALVHRDDSPVAVTHVLRTRFCTARGWFAYRDLTPAMRRAILSAADGVGFLAGWVTTQTVNRLETMGLVERCGFAVRLTFHGEVLWCEIDDPDEHRPRRARH